MTEQTTKNFLNLPKPHSRFEDSRYVILPLPYEKSVSYGEGTQTAPEAIISASAQVEFFDDETSAEACFERGIATLPALSFDGISEQKSLELIHQSARRLLKDDKIPIFLGGEHTITFGAIRAFLEVYPDLHIIQVDAHSDLRDEYGGNPLSHASVMKRIFDLAIPIHAVGIRAQCREESEFIQAHGIHTLYETERVGALNWCESFVAQIPAGVPVYFTIDVDGLDPAIMPSTGTPVPGGLNWRDILELSRAITDRFQLVGFDVTELAPQATNHAPDFLVAQLIYKIISYNEASSS